MDSIPIMREDLIKFTSDLEKETPGISFDYSEMDKLPHKDLWFIDIIQVNQLNHLLLEDLLGDIKKPEEEIETLKILEVFK